MALLVLTGAAIPAYQWAFAAADRGTPSRDELQAFIIQLQSITRPGERVALIVPPEFRDQDTVIYRARYLLPDRYFVSDPRGADVIAYWRVTPPAMPGRRARRLPQGFALR